MVDTPANGNIINVQIGKYFYNQLIWKMCYSRVGHPFMASGGASPPLFWGVWLPILFFNKFAEFYNQLFWKAYYSLVGNPFKATGEVPPPLF